MKKFLLFGKKLREYRVSKLKMNITETAKKLGVSRSYLSQLENGYEKPSQLVLMRISEIYKLNIAEQGKLYELGMVLEGRIHTGVTPANTIPLPSNASIKTTEGLTSLSKDLGLKSQKEVSMKKQKEKNQKTINVNVPENMPAVYSDSAFVTTNKYGAMIDFAQNIASSGNQTIVARVGLSLRHAEELAKIILKQVEKTKDSDGHK